MYKRTAAAATHMQHRKQSNSKRRAQRSPHSAAHPPSRADGCIFYNIYIWYLCSCCMVLVQWNELLERFVASAFVRFKRLSRDLTHASIHWKNETICCCYSCCCCAQLVVTVALQLHHVVVVAVPLTITKRIGDFGGVCDGDGGAFKLFNRQMRVASRSLTQCIRCVCFSANQ